MISHWLEEATGNFKSMTIIDPLPLSKMEYSISNPYLPKIKSELQVYALDPLMTYGEDLLLTNALVTSSTDAVEPVTAAII